MIPPTEQAASSEQRATFDVAQARQQIGLPLPRERGRQGQSMSVEMVQAQEVIINLTLQPHQSHFLGAHTRTSA